MDDTVSNIFFKSFLVSSSLSSNNGCNSRIISLLAGSFNAIVSSVTASHNAKARAFLSTAILTIPTSRDEVDPSPLLSKPLHKILLIVSSIYCMPSERDVFADCSIVDSSEFSPETSSPCNESTKGIRHFLITFTLSNLNFCITLLLTIDSVIPTDRSTRLLATSISMPISGSASLDAKSRTDLTNCTSSLETEAKISSSSSSLLAL
mmetsp:Transcript_9434/g.17765  ORF Transcript_9434/g.17765 Transcript_9434/m.17765 type:complete len:207 (-) Transcript_9434:1570-2190(-)